MQLAKDATLMQLLALTMRLGQLSLLLTVIELAVAEPELLTIRFNDDTGGPESGIGTTRLCCSGPVILIVVGSLNTKG